MHEQGFISKKYLANMFHRVNIVFEFELWEHNFEGEEFMVIVNTEDNSYTHADDDLYTVASHMDDYTWYEFRKERKE